MNHFYAWLKDVMTDVLHLRFRWVSLQLQYICTLRTEVSIRKRLGVLPATLRDLYQETYVKQLGGHVEDERLIAEATFRLLMCLREPLTTRNFLLALKFCGEERASVSLEAVLDLCANFVVLDTELDVFRFAHLSVREFLEKKEGFDTASNHAVAAECCLRYLLNVKPRYEVKTEDGWITDDDEGHRYRPTFGNRRYYYPCLCEAEAGDGCGIIDDAVPSDQHRAAFRNVCHEYACLYWLGHLNESIAHRHRPLLKTLFWKFMLPDQNSVTRQCAYWIDLNDLSDRSLDGWKNSEYEMRSIDISQTNYRLCRFACLVFVASAWNFCDVLQYCISIHPHIVRLTVSGCSPPLHIACRYGNVDAVEFLVDNGSHMERMTVALRTPIREALDYGNTMVVRLLLKKGATPNSEPADQLMTYVRHDTNLRKAAKCGHIDLVKALLDAGADLDQTGEYAETALDAAIHNGDVAMVTMMLESSGRTNEITNTPWIKATQLIKAVLNGNEADVSAMLREWPIAKMFAQYSNIALWSAARFNRRNCMQLLLEEGADVNFRYHGVPVLFAAAMSTSSYGLDERNCPLVESLLRQGADPNVVGDAHGPDKTLLLWAIRLHQLGLAHILLEQGVDINQDGPITSPLILASCGGTLRTVEFLLQKGADVEKIGRHSSEDPEHVRHSPLYWARKYYQRGTVQLLLRHGAKDGPDSEPHQHESGDCPYGPPPRVCPIEWMRLTDAADETERCNTDEDKALDDGSDVS